jgi:peptidoglycan/xylan/chitin deacetylase (PgdA/CDA1 family)
VQALKRVGAVTRAWAGLLETSGVRVLLYHSVGFRSPQDRLGLSVSLARFREQMAWLADAQVPVLSVEELVAGLTGRSSLPGWGVVISFDDGYRSAAEDAWQVLKAYGWPAVCFVSTYPIESDRNAYWSQWPRLSLEEWVTLDAEGFKVGAHGVSHRPLTGLSVSELGVELTKSRQVLESVLGRPVGWISYPHGAVNETVRRAALEAGFEAGFTSRPGAAVVDGELLTIPRIEVTAEDTLEDFQLKVRGAYDWLRAFRRIELKN